MQRKLLGGVFVVAALVFAANTASAVPIMSMKLSDGTNTTIVQDNGVGDTNSAVGAITFNGTIGDWSLNVSTGVATGPEAIDLNSFDSSAATTSTLNIWFTNPNLTTVWPGWEMNFGGTIENGSVVANGYADASNGLFGGTLIGSLGPFVGGPAPATAFSGSTTGGVVVTSPYSLTNQFSITGNGRQSTVFSGDFALDPVPEPGTLVLFGTALLGLAFGLRNWQTRRAE